ncbi:MAG: RNA polymerase sigma factor [Bacteroidales bacterium]|nr:RNA polymerase sigma factor [Bacteroidales bacterium]
MATSLEQTVAACKKHDFKAQRAFYNLFYRMVYNTCCRMLSNAMDAEECMQDAFVKAFGKFHAIGDAPPEAWLKRIAINTCLDALKAKHPDWTETDETLYIVNEPPPDEETMNWKVEQVKAAMEQLPEKYRIILSLYLMEGYDHEEIAEILQLNEATARSQYSRAKQKLIEIIKKVEI